MDYHVRYQFRGRYLEFIVVRSYRNNNLKKRCSTGTLLTTYFNTDIITCRYIKLQGLDTCINNKSRKKKEKKYQLKNYKNLKMKLD
jgi:hypothetical protein